MAGTNNSLKNKTLFITGASRGIGKAIALKAAKDGANISVVAKTAEPHPKLEGTVYTAAKEIEEAGGKALACVVDIRNEDAVLNAVKQTAEKFGGIDILINNASAISLTPTLQTSMKRFDLMHQVNTRGTFLCSKACIPFLEKAENPHILNLSPPLNLDKKWFASHVAYTMAKYGMSMCVLGMAEELKKSKIAVNALWPKTAIATAAIKMLMGEAGVGGSRKPSIVADTAHWILTQSSTDVSGHFFIDEDIVVKEKLGNLDSYAVDPSKKLLPDFFL